jgi:hypothetical protein
MATAGLARAEDREYDSAGLTGSWLVKLHFVTPFTADLLALVLFNNEGTFIGSLQGDGAGPGPAETPAYGVWKQTGTNAFTATAHAIQAGADSSLLGLSTLTLQLTLGANSNHLSGTWQFKTLDPNGNITFQSGGTLTATRIQIGDH